MKTLFSMLKEFIMDEDGLTTAEWVILASAVTAAAIAIAAVIIPKLKTLGNKVGTNLDTDPATPPAGQ